MKELSELIQLLTHYKVSPTNILPQGGEDSLYYKLFEGVREGAIEDDESALLYLYEDREGRSEDALQKLKYRLRKRLQQALLQIDFSSPEFSTYQLAHLNGMKYWGIVQTLLLHGKRNLAIPLARNIYQRAKKYELTELSLLLAKDLRLHYGSIEGDQTSFKKYNRAFKHYQHIFRLEELAEGYYTELAMNLVNMKSVDEETIQLAEKYADELEMIKEECNTYKFNLLRFSVLSMRYEIMADVDNTLDVCDRAIRYFETGTRDSNIALFTFQFKKLGAYIRKQAFELGKETARLCERLVKSESPNWFYTRDYYTLLCFKCGQYEEARYTYLDTTKRKAFNALGKVAGENWKLYEAYLHFFIQTEQLIPEDQDSTFMKRFKLGKFLNEMPGYSRDKRGMNISILILQMLFLLVHRRHDEVLDRIEALDQYCYRYLRKDDTFRSNCFIKMLVQIPKAHFHKAAVIRKAEKYRKRLSEVSMVESTQPLEIEIIPYEELWEIILEQLDHNFY